MSRLSLIRSACVLAGWIWFWFFLSLSGGHRYLRVLTHSFPTRRSSDLVGLGDGFFQQREIAEFERLALAVRGLGAARERYLVVARRDQRFDAFDQRPEQNGRAHV